MFQPLDTAPAYLRLSAAIRARILGRELGEGDSLPTETELARQFAVNRSTVREALRNLQSAGTRRASRRRQEALRQPARGRRGRCGPARGTHAA
jgi:DNA-binding GntR family transcriptional regulator